MIRDARRRGDPVEADEQGNLHAKHRRLVVDRSWDASVAARTSNPSEKNERLSSATAAVRQLATIKGLAT